MPRTFLIFPDAHGIPRGKLVNDGYRDGLEIGCASGVFSKDIFGIPQLFDILATPSGAADIRIRPEDGVALDFAPRPAFLPEFLFGASAVAIGTVTDPSQAPHPLDFRRILRDLIAEHSDLGRYRFGGELEFFLRPHHDIPSFRPDGQAYAFSSAVTLQGCLDAMMAALDHVGIPWEGFSQENDLNQFEFSLGHSGPLAQADRIFLARFVMRNVAAAHGLRCTFTPVLDRAGSPSNLHLHISDPEAAGIDALCHAAMTALGGPFLPLCPTRNGRLVQHIDSFSSKKADMGEGHRFRALRILRDGSGDRIELRTPTADANPYLAILMVLACLRYVGGAPEGAEPSPLERDIAWDFETSIANFAADPIVRSVLGEETIDLYTAMKRLEGAQFDEMDFNESISRLQAVI
ncbi:MAG: hypothetical protein NXI16_03840 [Alphaproteobacteria bacterium]|nr:hypothetical protein [Alphaproteobacteria bacterium]